jgi:DNA primase
VAKRFGIGYAPDGWQNLEAVFPDYAAPALAAAGLVKQSEGRRYDIFRDRIMFPIVDVRGSVIGFGGRVLEAAEGAKYLNSPETPVFEKGRELYGLYQARRAIRDAGRVLVVEGYMDVVALAQHDVGYAVATLGTATSGVHVQKLLRQADEVVFSFDGDAAGRRAAWRALETSLPELVDGKEVRFLFLPQGEDPDSYVRAHGKDGFERLLGAAIPLSRYFLDELTAQADIASAEGRAKLVHAAKPLVTQLQNNTFRLQILKDLAEKARLTLEEVETLCGIANATRARRRPESQRGSQRMTPELSRKLLRLLLDSPQLARTLSPEQAQLLRDDDDFAVVIPLIDTITRLEIDNPAALIEATRESPDAALYSDVRSHNLDSPSNPDDVRAELEGIFQQLRWKVFEAEYRQLNAKSPRSEAEEDRYRQLCKQLPELKGAGGVGLRSPS